MKIELILRGENEYIRQLYTSSHKPIPKTLGIAPAAILPSPKCQPIKKLFTKTFPEKYIFDVYDEKLKSITNTEIFLNELKKAAQNYAELINPASDKIYLNGIRTLNITKCYPLLLKGKEILNDKNFQLLSKAIECISFRHYIMRSDPKELEKLYFGILGKLKSNNDDIDIIIEEIKQHPTMKQIDKFKSEFINISPKSNISKMILSRIVGFKQESIDLVKGDIWMEHIMPQKPQGEWLKIKESDNELYEFSVDRIGNLTLLQNKLNQGASNKEFNKKKKDYYEKSRLKITKDLEKYDSWNVNSIDERQIELYELAKDVWAI